MNDFPDIFCYCENVTTRNKTEKIKSDIKCTKFDKLLITNGQLERAYNSYNTKHLIFNDMNSHVKYNKLFQLVETLPT